LKFKKLVYQYLNMGIRETLEPSLVIRIRLLNVLNLSCVLISLIYAWINSSIHEIATLINLLSILVNIGIYGLIFAKKYILAFFAFLLLSVFIGASLAILFGRYIASDLLFCTGIAYSIAMFEKRLRIFFGVALNLVCFVLALYFYETYLPVFHEANEQIKYFYYPNAAVFLMILFVLVFLLKTENQRYERTLQEKNKQLNASNQKNEELIENILPKRIAAELKRKGEVQPKLYKNVTVMFTDFYQFTRIAENMTAMHLVRELDTYFKAFDKIIEKYGIEKLKTIGDAYMCASGIPEEREDHAMMIIHAALEIKELVEKMHSEREVKGIEAWQIRIGIHSGNVVAGIIGDTKFTFDIWGDTVNTASRLESHSEPGKVNISSNTYELIKDIFKCEYRGKIKAKSKGEIDMYFVEGLL
jgi:class 3 adenylate cyclase